MLLSTLILVGGVPIANADNVQLGLQTTGVGASVQLNPPGRLLGCKGQSCYYEFARGTVVTATATPTARASSLARWLGACSHSSPTCVVQLDQNKGLTARFSPVSLYAYPSGSGSVSVAPQGRSCDAGCWTYPYGSAVTITAQPAANYAFGGWSGYCSSVRGTACNVRLWDNVETSAAFNCTTNICQTRQPIVRTVQTTVTVQGQGSVLVNSRTCTGAREGASCRYEFQRGAPLVLVARGSGFAGWSGSCRGRSPRCQFDTFRDPSGKLPKVFARFG
jgi:hypothetical protein